MKPRKADGFREVSLRAVEDYAEKMLVVNTVLGIAATEAAQGHRIALIPIERPIAVAETEHAKELKRVLEAEGFKIEWRKRSIIIAGNEATAWVLAVMW